MVADDEVKIIFFIRDVTNIHLLNVGGVMLAVFINEQISAHIFLQL